MVDGLTRKDLNLVHVGASLVCEATPHRHQIPLELPRSRNRAVMKAIKILTLQYSLLKNQAGIYIISAKMSSRTTNAVRNLLLSITDKATFNKKHNDSLFGRIKKGCWDALVDP